MWRQYLRNQNFPVVEFNAWQTDFSEDPFVALSTELTSQLSLRGDAPLRAKVLIAKDAAKKVLVRAVPGLIRLSTAGLVDVGPLASSMLSEALESYAEERLARYADVQESIRDFRTSLEEVSTTLAASHEGKPLVVMVDELDRCRPTYAIELLETTKHLFSVDHVVFILATNKSALAHSVKALYGNEFDAVGYLHRFFELDLHLPPPNRKEFTRAMIRAVQLDMYFERTRDRSAQEESAAIHITLVDIFDRSSLSLRSIAQAIYRFGLVFASLGSKWKSFITMATVALIIRTLDVGVYYQFIHNEVSDSDVVNRITSHLISTEDDYAIVVLEALIIVAAKDNQPLERRQYSSPLLARYKDLVEKDAGQFASVEARHAAEVVRLAEQYEMRSRFDQVGSFKYAVSRIELVSKELINEPSGDSSS